MKQLILSVILGLVTQSASAACYNFINGRGPDKIGNFQFGGTAKQVCIQKVNGFAGPAYTQLTLSDEQGPLAIAGIGGQANCTTAQLCQTLELTHGNINGQNVDLRGTTITLEAAKNSLQVVVGKMSVKAGRDFPQPFLIMEVKR